MKLCLILFTSQQMTLYFLPVFLYLQIESVQKNILKMVTFGRAERWLFAVLDVTVTISLSFVVITQKCPKSYLSFVTSYCSHQSLELVSSP